jgi:TM2 domain-containing membrane protein YozV
MNIHPDAEICVKCGVRQVSVKKVEHVTDKSRVAYALFYIFLWPIGLHEFYVNKTGKGIAWLIGSLLAVLTSVIGIGLIAIPIMSTIAFVLGIVWLTRTDEAFAKYVNQQ